MASAITPYCFPPPSNATMDAMGVIRGTAAEYANWCSEFSTARQVDAKLPNGTTAIITSSSRSVKASLSGPKLGASKGRTMPETAAAPKAAITNPAPAAANTFE